MSLTTPSRGKKGIRQSFLGKDWWELEEWKMNVGWKFGRFVFSSAGRKRFFSRFSFFFLLLSRDRVERALHQKAADNTYAEAVDYSQFFSPTRNPISSYENWVGEWARRRRRRWGWNVFFRQQQRGKRWMSETKLPRRVSSEQYFSPSRHQVSTHTHDEKNETKRQQISHLILHKSIATAVSLMLYVQIPLFSLPNGLSRSHGPRRKTTHSKSDSFCSTWETWIATLKAGVCVRVERLSRNCVE